VLDRPHFKDAHSKALATATEFRKGWQDAHVTVDVWIICYVGSDLELKLIEKGKIVLPWDDFFQVVSDPKENLKLRHPGRLQSGAPH